MHEYHSIGALSISKTNKRITYTNNKELGFFILQVHINLLPISFVKPIVSKFQQLIGY